ncbi:MAG: hypothetical protein ABIY55_35530 [Kofleriaceae bacterium]
MRSTIGIDVNGNHKADTVTINQLPFASRDRCRGTDVLVGRNRDRGEQPVFEALVVALEMVVLEELRDLDVEVALT